MRKPAIMSLTFQTMIKAPIVFAARIKDGMGMSDVYMSRIDSLLKQMVAFQSSANDRMP